MVRIFCIASLALAAVSAVSGHVIPHKRAPPGWEAAILQNYPQYHDRYLSWKCQDQHNTTFFEKCCHPLLNREPISVLTNLGCEPPTEPNNDDECDDGESSVPPSSTPSSSYQPAYTAPSHETPSPSPSPSLSSPAGSIEKPESAPPVSTPAEPTSTPTTTPTKVTTPSPAPSSTGDGGGFNFGGVATFFLQNGVAGACGQVHQDSDFIAAMDQQRYGNSGGQSELCGKQVLIFNTDNGQSVTVTVADDCPTCDNANSIDLSEGAFKMLATEVQGEVPIKWQFL